MNPSVTQALGALTLSLFLAAGARAQKRAGADASPAGGARERSVMESDTDKFGLSQLGQVAVSVEDLGRATAFYRDRLGMRHLFTSNGMAFFDCGGVRLMLTGLEQSGRGLRGFVLYFKVGEIQQAYKTLAGRGVRFEEAPELAARTEKFELWLACFKDSEGNDLCLMSEVPPK